MKRNYIGKINEKNVGSSMLVKGWVDTIREHGKLIFLDVRDISGILQTVVSAKNKDIFAEAKKLTKESCVSIEGTINLRPKGTENEKILTGKVELEIKKLEIYNICPALPFELDKEDIGEEIRLKYRFLDLRRSAMQQNLIARAKIIKTVREFFDNEGFIDVETPILVKSTPGGARNFLVPSRNEPGKFFALPESPQLFKQLLMVAGMERYYQIAKCMRDEDLRKDRQPEFTQIDVEMSFITQDDIIDVIERLLQKIWKDVLNINIKVPFKRMTYQEAMKKYNTDKPDLRKETGEKYAFLWVVDFPLFQYSEEEKKYAANHHPFTSPNLEDFKKDPFKARSHAYDVVLNGVEIGGGSIRIHDQQIQQKVFDILQIELEEQQAKFAFLLNALKYGAPPHGGIALGVDRIIQIILETESIREVIAFPKNSDARDIMLDAPSEVDTKQLKELHIKLDLPKKK